MKFKIFRRCPSCQARIWFTRKRWCDARCFNKAVAGEFNYQMTISKSIMIRHSDILRKLAELD